MKLQDFDYKLNTKLIAQKPKNKRDTSKLLVYNTSNSKIKHCQFLDLVDYLQAGDVLVLNNSKVMPARLLGKKQTGGKAEVFLLPSPPTPSPTGRGGSVTRQCLLKVKGSKIDLKIYFENNLEAKVIGRQDEVFTVEFNKSGKQLQKIIDEIGLTPLPPYIKRDEKSSEDKKKYQTVYANDKKLGSVAAPTAGLHFTNELLKKLKNKGVQIEYVTLHVGLGTFQPVKTDNIKKHKMHAEFVEVDKKVIKNIIKAKKENRRVVAVGTTSVRVLESAVAKNLQQTNIKNIYEAVNIFIYPGFKFKIVDMMITNFHLPKSTLLMLVSAFLQNKGIENGTREIKKIYKIAQDKKYRFFSYGDAMLITSPPTPILGKERGGK